MLTVMNNDIRNPIPVVANICYGQMRLDWKSFG